MDQDNIIDVCPCCGSPFDNQKIPVCVKHNELDFLGPGFPLFYEFLIFCIVCIFLLLCIQGIYGLRTNYDGNACYLANFRISGQDYKPCSENWINIFSWFNKVERDDLQSGLNLLGSFALLIILNIFKFRHKSVEIEVDNNNISPSDYTVQVSELPLTEKEEDIKVFFENCIAKRKITVSKVTMAYQVENYIALKRKKDELISIQSNLLSSISFSQKYVISVNPKTLKKKNAVENDLVLIQKKIEAFEKECETNAGEKFCGVVFLSLQSEEDHKALIDYWKMSLLQTLLVLFMAKVLKKKTKTYKGKIISLVRAPEPTDVIWENLGYTTLYRVKALFITNFGTFLTLVLCGGAIFGINFAQAYLAEEAKTDSSIGFFVQGIGILAAVVVLIVNFLLQKIVNSLVKY